VVRTRLQTEACFMARLGLKGLSLAKSICSNISSVSLLRLSFRISPAVLKARSMPADVAGMIKCDSCMRCMCVCVNGGLNFDGKLSRNCETNCEFQSQLEHLQLRLQLQIGKNAELINCNYNYLNK